MKQDPGVVASMNSSRSSRSPDGETKPVQLYGRQAQVALLRQVLTTVQAEGGSARILITGESGTGKTQLVNTAFRSGSQQQCLLGHGKLEQQGCSRKPYAALVDCFSDLCQAMLRLADCSDNNKGNNNTDNADYPALLRNNLAPSQLQELASLMPQINKLVEIEEDSSSRTSPTHGNGTEATSKDGLRYDALYLSWHRVIGLLFSLLTICSGWMPSRSTFCKPLYFTTMPNM